MSVSSATSDIRQSESVAAIAKALFKVQSEMESVSKDAENTAFKGSRYATFTAVWNQLHPKLMEAGLIVMQSPGEGRIVESRRANEPNKWEKKEGAVTEFIDESIYIMKFTTRVTHAESGEWIESVSEIPTRKIDPQGYGSSVTYARRYCLSPLIGIVVDDDDDGNAGSGNNTNHNRQQKTQEPPKDNNYQKVRAFLVNAGCATAEAADTVLDFILQGQSSGSIKNEDNAAAILNAIEKAAKNKEYTSDNVLDKATVTEEANDAFPV